MTGEVINLRRVRKQRARSDKRRRGDENATLHGRLGAEKRLTDALKQMEERRFDGHKRETDDVDSPEGERDK